MTKQFYFKQFSVAEVRSLVLFDSLIKSGATTLGQSRPGNNGNEGVHSISQSSSNAETYP